MPAWRSRLLILAIASSAGLASGCATIATGGSQAIHIQSQPADAQCTLTREGQTLGSLVTPGDVTVSLSRHPIRVNCRKADYQDTAELLVAKHEPLRLLNVVPLAAVPIVGIVGDAADYASGAYVQYPKDLKVWLVPSGARADLANVPPGMAAAPSPLDGRYFGTLRSYALPSRFAPVQIDLQIVLGPRQRNRQDGRLRRSGRSDGHRRFVRRGCRQVPAEGRGLPRVGDDFYRADQGWPNERQDRQGNGRCPGQAALSLEMPRPTASRKSARGLGWQGASWQGSHTIATRAYSDRMNAIFAAATAIADGADYKCRAVWCTMCSVAPTGAPTAGSSVSDGFRSRIA